MSAKVWYSVGDDHRFAIDQAGNVTRPIEQRGIVEECAEDYFSNHDGWESTWPLEFTLYESETSADGVKFTVEMEGIPSFYAHRNETHHG